MLICKVKVALIRKADVISYNNYVDPMLTTSEVARILSVHINTVRRWSNQGVLKSYRIGSRGDRRFRREDINSFFSKGGNSDGESQAEKVLD